MKKGPILLIEGQDDKEVKNIGFTEFMELISARHTHHKSYKTTH